MHLVKNKIEYLTLAHIQIRHCGITSYKSSYHVLIFKIPHFGDDNLLLLSMIE